MLDMILFRVTRDMKTELKKIVDKEDYANVSELCRDIIRKYLNEKGVTP